GAVLYGLFFALDLLVAWEHRWLFFAIRLGVILWAFATLALVATRWGRRHALTLSLGILIAASTGVSVMTTHMGGFAMEYYCGHLVVLFFVGLFMPWHLGVTVAFCCVLCGIYFGLNAWSFPLTTQAVNPFFFLTGTSAFTCASVVASERARRRDVAQRLRLER